MITNGLGEFVLGGTRALVEASSEALETIWAAPRLRAFALVITAVTAALTVAQVVLPFGVFSIFPPFKRFGEPAGSISHARARCPSGSSSSCWRSPPRRCSEARSAGTCRPPAWSASPAFTSLSTTR